MNKQIIFLSLTIHITIAENPKDVETVLKAVYGKSFQDPVAVKDTFKSSDKKNCICKNCDFSHGSSLSSKNLEGCDLEGSNFDGSDLRKTIFIGTNLSGTSFKNANLEEADFSAANGTKFLPYQEYKNVPVLPQVRDSRPALKAKGVSFENSNLKNVKFVNSKFEYSNFTYANIDKANFLCAQLNHSNLSHTSAYDTIFKGANLEDVNMNKMKPTNIWDENIQSRLIYTGGHTDTKDKYATFQMPLPINFCCTTLPNGKLFSVYNSATCTNEQMAKYGDLKHQRKDQTNYQFK